MKHWIPTLALGLVLTSTAVLARNPMSMGGHAQDGGLGMLAVMAEEIGLTMSQEDSINQLVNDARLANAVDRERMSQLHRQLQNAAQNDDSFDEAAVTALAEEMAELVARMTVERAQLRWEVRQVLTDEQRAQLDSIRKHARMSHFRFTDGEPSEL